MAPHISKIKTVPNGKEVVCNLTGISFFQSPGSTSYQLIVVFIAKQLYGGHAPGGGGRCFSSPCLLYWETHSEWSYHTGARWPVYRQRGTASWKGKPHHQCAGRVSLGQWSIQSKEVNARCDAAVAWALPPARLHILKAASPVFVWLESKWAGGWARLWKMWAGSVSCRHPGHGTVEWYQGTGQHGWECRHCAAQFFLKCCRIEKGVLKMIHSEYEIC